MAASQNNHPLPHSDEWTQYSPEYVLEHHPAPLQDVLLVYVSMVHERGEMKAHGDKHGVKKNSLNVVTKKLSTTTERLCIIKNLNFPSWRRSYDETVSLYKRYEAGKRGSELEEKIDVHPAHEVPDESE